MADETTRIINLAEATEIADGMYLVTDASTGTRKLSLQKILDKAGANVFYVYDPTSTYAVGDLCVYSGALYECTTAITTPEAWNSAHWARADLSAIIKDIDDSIDELYEEKADADGTYDDLIAGTAKQLLGQTIETSQEAYILKKTGVESNREKLKIAGLTIVWNQLCNGSSVTVTSGHKYYMKKAGVESIGASDGTALTGLTSGEDMVIDLTQLFGSSAIANHIYDLEQSKAGDGVSWLHKYIGIGSYRDYSAPTLTSVDNLDEHILSGFNQMSVENFTTGNNYNKAIGEQLDIGESGCTVSGENPVIITNTVADIGVAFGGFPLIPGQEYTISYRIKGSTPANIKRSYYITDENAYVLQAENFSSVTHDENYVFVDSITSNIPGGRFVMAIQSSTAQTVEVYDLCVHLKGDGKRDGEYEPYETHEYPLDYMITLRGLAKLDSNGNLYADGDIYPPSGEVSVRFGQRAYQSGDESLANAITDGTNTVYKLSTPTTETANPYPEVQFCNKYGTEEFKTTDGLVPVGNTTEYLSDIQSQVKNLQDEKADKVGEYENLVAGSSEQLLSTLYTTNTEPYLFRKTGGDSDRERVKRIEGLSVGWNQLCNASSVTVTSGHKYYMKKAGVESIGASDGTALTGLTSGTDMVIDLTILFGSSTIADHIYSLEQATAGAGVAWVKQYIDLDSYHAYSQPTIKSVEGLTSHDMVGWNQWDEETTLGFFAQTGKWNSNSDYFSSKNPIPVVPNATYYCHCGTSGANVYVTLWKNMVPSGVSNYNDIIARINVTNQTFVIPDGCVAIHFNVASYGTTYNHDICINLSDPSRNGEYEPYEKHSYPLDSTITLRGIGKLVDGKLVADGDWYEPSGALTVRYAERAYQSGDESLADAITDGTTTVYKLTTPTTSTALSYSEVQVCESGGTEEFVTDSVVPVGTVTEYPADLRKQVENIYGIPKPPSTAGTYHLTLTVADGVPTFTWESES